MFAGKYKNAGKGRARRMAAGIVFAYAFYLLFPHFDAVTHVHDGGDHGHTHSFLSAHDVALEREVLAVTPEGRPQGELAKKPASRPAAPAATASPIPEGLTPTPQIANQHDGAHTHFQENPNLPTLAVVPVTTSLLMKALLAPATVPLFVPALAILASPARAPPRA